MLFAVNGSKTTWPPMIRRAAWGIFSLNQCSRAPSLFAATSRRVRWSFRLRQNQVVRRVKVPRPRSGARKLPKVACSGGRGRGTGRRSRTSCGPKSRAHKNQVVLTPGRPSGLRGFPCSESRAKSLPSVVGRRWRERPVARVGKNKESQDRLIYARVEAIASFAVAAAVKNRLQGGIPRQIQRKTSRGGRHGERRAPAGLLRRNVSIPKRGCVRGVDKTRIQWDGGQRPATHARTTVYW